MPQASDELRALMNRWFPEDAELGAMQFLSSHGFQFQRDGMIAKPTPSYTVSKDEWACLDYMADEWDHSWEFDTYDSPPIVRHPT